MKNGFTMITQKGRNHGDYLAMFQHLQLNQIFMEKTLVLYLVGSAWYRVLWVAQIERNNYWGCLLNTIDDIESSTQGKARPLLPQTLLLLISTYFDRWRMVCLSSTSHHMKKTKNWVDSWIVLKDEAFFRRGFRMLSERWEKVVASDGQYFE